MVYVGNDPIVLAPARALLTSGPQGATGYLDADMREPDTSLVGARPLPDLTKPVGIMLVAVLPVLRDDEGPQAIVGKFLAAVPGSFLVISHLASDGQQDAMARMGRTYNSASQPASRSPCAPREQVTRFFDGLTLAGPGVVLTRAWRPGPG